MFTAGKCAHALAARETQSLVNRAIWQTCQFSTSPQGFHRLALNPDARH
jgi:hypothetical protein